VSLEGLNLQGTQITAAGVQRLEAQLPGCRIVADEALARAASMFEDEVGQVPQRQPQLIAPRSRDTEDALESSLADESDPSNRLTRLLEQQLADPRLLRTVGDLYRERGDLDAAIAAYSEAVIRQPDDPVSQHRLGIALAESGDLANAHRHLQYAVGVAAADYNIAVILYRQGRIAESRTAAQAALRADLAYRPARALLALLAKNPEGPGSPSTEMVHSPAADLVLGALHPVLPRVNPRPRWEVAIQPATSPDTAAAVNAATDAATASRPTILKTNLLDESSPQIRPLDANWFSP
jgi:tetratricopeptide (TPR) repeat protein